MIVCLSFYEGDADAAMKLLEWVRDMGRKLTDHSLLLTVPRGVDAKAHVEASRGTWGSVEAYEFHDRCEAGWPFAANHAWKRSVEYIEFKYGDVPFLWLESDAIPLKPSWIEEIAAEYKACGKNFMGAHSRKGKSGSHMNGVGVWRYPSKYAASSMLVSNPQGRDRNPPPIAFDQAAGDEVIPQFKESKLFQFLYRHEDIDLWLRSPSQWLDPNAVIFHTEKTGKLIDWLRAQGVEQQKADAPVVKQTALPRFDTNLSSPTHCVFIKSWKQDTEWLYKAVESIQATASGIAEIVVVTDDESYKQDGVRVVCQPQGDRGYIEQQYVKLTADAITNCDVITYTDSDVIFESPWSIDNLMDNGRLVWRLTPRSVLGENHPWWPVMEAAIGKRPEHEFMRRHPHTVKREHLKEFREWMQAKHHVPLVDFMYARHDRDFSEFNVLGFWLYEHKRDEYVWAGDDYPLRFPNVTQYHSWTQKPGVTITTKALGALIANGEEPSGFAIIEGDECISRFVKETGTMDHGDFVARSVAGMLKAGDWVVDGGANIGTHSYLYVQAVGKAGKVLAFEPNPKARACLEKNVKGIDIYPVALGDKEQMVCLEPNANVGATKVIEQEGNIVMRTLDSFAIPKLTLLKLDVEGWEERALQGAMRHIKRHRPIIVVEIYKGLGTSLGRIKDLLAPLDYACNILQPECNESSPIFDVVFTPGERPKKKGQKGKRC